MKKITLIDAYHNETLRNYQVTYDEILKAVKNKQAEKFKKYHKDFDFTLLYELQKDLKDILIKGYQVKFLTLPGLKNLLRMKYDKEEGNDYETKETSLEIGRASCREREKRYERGGPSRKRRRTK